MLYNYMSYNILPKNNNAIIIAPCLSSACHNIYKSTSFFNLYLKKKKELEDVAETIGLDAFNKLISIVNINEFICQNLTHPISEVLYPHTNVFFDLIEIATNLNLIDTIKSCNHCSHISANCSESVKFIKHCDKDQSINYECPDFEEINKIPDGIKYDFCFMEITSDDVSMPASYIIKILKSLVFITRSLKKGSLLILKMDYLFYKPVMDLLYILSCTFEKTYIIKPSTSNVLSFEKYVICKNLIRSDIDISFYNDEFMRKLIAQNTYVTSLMSEDIPCYFINKITEIDVMLGQIVLESIQEIVNVSHNNNQYDKIENLKKNNIQKANVWCNKYKIQGNLFLERKNMFLTAE